MSAQVILEEEYDENYEPTDEDIAEYGVMIGVDPVKEPHLMSIAREGINAPLPNDWKPCQDTNGDIYYFNFKTGASTWDHPCDDYYKKKVNDARLKKDASPSGQVSPKAAPAVGKKKKKGDGKEKNYATGSSIDSLPTASLAPLKSGDGLAVGSGLVPLKSLGGVPGVAQKPSLLSNTPTALKGASMSASEEDSTTNMDGISSMNFQGASHEYDSPALELYTASATANKSFFATGNIICLVARWTGKALQIVACPDGHLTLNGLGLEGPQAFNTHWTVINEGSNVIRLHNNSNYLCIDSAQIMVMLSPGGVPMVSETRLRVSQAANGFITLESVKEPGHFLAIGQFGGPAPATLDLFAKHFAPKLLYSPYGAANVQPHSYRI